VRRPRLSPPAGVAPFLWGSFACLPPLRRLLSGPRCRPGTGSPEPPRCAGEPGTEPVRPAPPAPRARSTGTVRSIAPAASVPHGLSPPGSPTGAGQPRLALWDAFLCIDRCPGQCRRGGAGAFGRPGRLAALACHEVPVLLPRVTRCCRGSPPSPCGAGGGVGATLLAPFSLQPAARAGLAHLAGIFTFCEHI